jgi:hypothetical protein
VAKTLIERTGGYEYMNARAALVQAFRERMKATGKDQNGVRPRYPSYRKAEHKRLMNEEGRYDRDVSLEKAIGLVTALGGKVRIEVEF